MLINLAELGMGGGLEAMGSQLLIKLGTGCPCTLQLVTPRSHLPQLRFETLAARSGGAQGRELLLLLGRRALALL